VGCVRGATGRGRLAAALQDILQGMNYLQSILTAEEIVI
jgi:hypothetical protein